MVDPSNKVDRPASSREPTADVAGAAKPSDVAANAPKEVAGARPDAYRATTHMQRIFDVMERVGVLAGFRLPGSERMVQDRRAEGEGRSERNERGEGRDRTGEQGRAERSASRDAKRAGGSTGGERDVIERATKALHSTEVVLTGKERSQVSADGKEKALSAFEKALMGRFEGAEEQAPESKDGQVHFLKKTAGEWMQFFEKFVSRTLQKAVGWEEVKGFLFRGLVQEKGLPQKGVLISDVQTLMGTDKFARLSVSLPKVMAFAAANPGVAIPKEVVQAAMTGEQLRYLALGASRAEEGAGQFAQAASRGLFSSQQLENRVAEQLGLVSEFRGVPMGQRDAHDVEAERQAGARRRRSGWARWLGGDDVNGEGSVFVPWWRWDREERSGARRWFVVVFGSVAIIIMVALLFALFHALR